MTRESNDARPAAAGPRERRAWDPQPIGRLLDEMVATRGWEDRMAVGRLREAWTRVVGEHVAARSMPVGLRDGVLTIRAEPGAWSTELALLGRSLAAKADAHLGGAGRIRAVRITADDRRLTADDRRLTHRR